MGGIETNIDGLTRIPGVWAAGEAAAVSLHGANRLGANSTGECLVWGAITGAEIAKALEMPLGRREFRLLGTAEFGSVSHFLSQGQRAQFSGESAANVTGVLKHGHKVAVKGLLIADKAAPKLNVLSVQSLTPECR